MTPFNLGLVFSVIGAFLIILLLCPKYYRTSKLRLVFCILAILITPIPVALETIWLFGPDVDSTPICVTIQNKTDKPATVLPLKHWNEKAFVYKHIVLPPRTNNQLCFEGEGIDKFQIIAVDNLFTRHVISFEEFEVYYREPVTFIIDSLQASNASLNEARKAVLEYATSRCLHFGVAFLNFVAFLLAVILLIRLLITRIGEALTKRSSGPCARCGQGR